MNTRRLCITLIFSAAAILLYWSIYMNSSVELPLNKSAKEEGVLVLAHGGSPRWNRAVLKTSAELAEKYPTAIAFGMADTESVQRAVDTLEGLGVKKIIAVPLFISSHSELYRQTEFILGLRDGPDPDFVEGMHRAMEHPLEFIWHKVSWENIPVALSMIRHHRSMRYDRRVVHGVPLELRPALDGSALVGEILEKRVMALSKNEEAESVLVVAHGPIRDEDDALWLGDMEKLVAPLKKLHFRAVCVATMRDDAPAEVKNKAIARMREIAAGCAARKIRLIVVPLLLAPGGVEGEIRHILKGLPYVYDGRTLLPDENISRWLVESAEEAEASSANSATVSLPFRFPRGSVAASGAKKAN